MNDIWFEHLGTQREPGYPISREPGYNDAAMWRQEYIRVRRELQTEQDNNRALISIAESVKVIADLLTTGDAYIHASVSGKIDSHV